MCLQGESCSEKWLNQAKQVEWQNWFGDTLPWNSAQNTIFHCHGNLILLHLSLKTQKQQTYHYGHCHSGLQTQIWTHFTLRNLLLSASAVNLISCEIWRSQIILTILWVPSSQKSLVSRTDIWQRIKQSYKQNLCTSKLAWALCSHCLYLCLLYCIQVKRAAVPSVSPAISSLCLGIYFQIHAQQSCSDVWLQEHCSHLAVHF